MKTVQINPKLPAKRVDVFKEPPISKDDPPTIVKHCKPGEKLKTDNRPVTQYAGFMGDSLYQRVYVNGQEGWIYSEALRG